VRENPPSAQAEAERGMPPEDALEAAVERLLFIRPVKGLAEVKVGGAKPPDPMESL